MSALIGFRSLAARSGSCLSKSYFATGCASNVLNQKWMEKTALVKRQETRLMSSHGDHSKLWSIERMVSAALLGLIPASFALPIPGADYLLATALMVHVHWGIEAIAIDYVRPIIFGDTVPKIALGLVYLLSILSLSGLFYFNYTDVGMVQGMKMAWKTL